METLDQDAVNLSKAIRQSESGGDFSAKGKSGEYGAYQFTEPTWNAQATKYGVNTSLKQSTKEQQNEVAYRQIKEWKDKGFNPGQIASMWNAGADEPDAYTGKFSNGQPSVGKNKLGVKFDVPAYAKSVADAYQSIKNGGNPGIDSDNPSATQPNGYDNSTYLNNTSGQNTQEQPTTEGGKAMEDLGKGNYLGALGHGALGATKGALKFGEKALNEISSPFAGLAAIPTQILAGAMGQEDPFKQGIAGGKSSYKVSGLTAGEKGKDLLKAGITTGGAALGGIASNLLKGTSALASPALEEALPVSKKVFGAMTNANKLNVLDDALKLSDTSASAKLIIKKAIEEVTPLAEKELGLAPGLLKKAIGKGGQIALKSAKGILKLGAEAAGVGGALGIYDKYIK